LALINAHGKIEGEGENLRGNKIVPKKKIGEKGMQVGYSLALLFSYFIIFPSFFKIYQINIFL